jgi:chromosome segregation ATPase
MEVVKRTLITFDSLCKELESAKKLAASGNKSSSEIGKLRAELAKCQAEQQKLRVDFEKWESECRDLIAKNADKHKKKIKKIYSKLEDDVQLTTEVEKKAKEAEDRLRATLQASMGDGPDVETLKKQYTTTFEIIQGFRQSMPDIYNAAEQETGIFFFTMPK